GRKVELAHRLDGDALAARAAFQPVALARLDAFRLEGDELRVEAAPGHRLAVDGDDHVAARDVHLAVENERDGVPGDGRVAHEVEGDDLGDVRHHARGQDGDAVARLHRAAGNRALIAAEAFAGARDAL